MRKIALCGLLVAISISLGCRGGRLGCFRGAPCRSGCGSALPPAPPVGGPTGGCNTCGPVTSGYGSYDGGVINESIVGDDYYGQGVISGDYYSGPVTETVLPGSSSSSGTITPPMSTLPTN